MRGWWPDRPGLEAAAVKINELPPIDLKFYSWVLEQIDKHYAASALWMFKPLPTPRVFGMACAEQYKLGMKSDTNRAGLVGNT